MHLNKRKKNNKLGFLCDTKMKCLVPAPSSSVLFHLSRVKLLLEGKIIRTTWICANF